MKKRIAVIIVLIATLLKGYGANNVEISLLTCSLGEEVYATFGHSAIRVKDKEAGADKVYNFGMFDFGTPNFQLKFMQGKLEYQLGIQSFEEFLEIYNEENRLVVEQALNLTEAEKAKIIERLEFLYLPENRYYLYEFCKKNCTTELRDIIFNTIVVDTSSHAKSIHKTYRTLFNECLVGKPWLRLGINLILGSDVDKDINAHESMFLPEYLRAEVDRVRVNGQSLVVKETALNTIQPSGFNYQNLFSPLIIFSILLLLVFFCKSVRLEPFIFAIVGLIGILVLFLSITTDHVELKNNFNLLWINPLYFISAILLLLRQRTIQKYLSYFYLALIGITIILWIIGIQAFEIAFIPLIITLIVCNFRIIKEDKKKAAQAAILEMITDSHLQ